MPTDDYRTILADYAQGRATYEQALQRCQAAASAIAVAEKTRWGQQEYWRGYHDGLAARHEEGGVPV